MLAVTVMRVLFFVLDVSLLREYESDGNVSVGNGDVRLQWVRGRCMWVVHVVHVLCLAQITC